MKDIFNAICQSTKEIKRAINFKNFKYLSKENSSGETQLKLDVEADLIIQKEFSKLLCIKALASEENEKTLQINLNGEYLIGFDPLDGSSLVDVNLSVGSIFGIYKNDFSGKNLVAACYVIYGPNVEIVWADQKDVKLYVLENEEFKYVKDLKLEKEGKLNAPGGTQKNWTKKHKKMVDELFAKGYRLRYSGGMVPDLHHILLKKGGLFSYPTTVDAPKGKLRMIFEIFPFAHIFEVAGGHAVNGEKRVLELTPEHLHDTSACFFGSSKEIELVLKTYGS